MAARKSPSRKSPSIDPERFPHLAAFLAGYLHQDFVLDHKTPAGALKAFLADAGPKDRAALVADRAMRAMGLDGRALLPLKAGGHDQHRCVKVPTGY